MSELTDGTEPELKDLMVLQLTTLMRIYDVLLGLLDHFDSQSAQILLDEHTEFHNIGPLPYVEED